jgi:hypothetical protein
VIADTLAAFRVHEDAKTAAGDRLWEEIFATRRRHLRGRQARRALERARWRLRDGLGRLGLGPGVGNSFR